MKITISGWYGHFNAGDDAILQVFIEQVTQRLDCRITVLSELPENIEATQKVGGLFHLPISLRSVVSSLVKGDFRRYLQNLAGSDLFVLGGGGLLRDNTTWRNLIRLLDEIWLSKMLGRKVMLYAIGVGPFRSRLGKRLIGMSVRMCDLITVRDANSARLLSELGVSSNRIHVVADPAFLLTASVPRDNGLVDMLPSKRKVGVFPTWHSAYETGDLSEAARLATALDELVEKYQLQFVALPMQVSDSGMDDVKFSRAIKSAMKYPESLEIYDRRLTPSELKWAAGRTIFNITVRLHAMIFSLGAGVPVVATNYEPKVGNVFSILGCPQYLVELDNNFLANHTAAVDSCMKDLSDYEQKIVTSRAEYETSAARTFELLQALLTNSTLRDAPVRASKNC